MFGLKTKMINKLKKRFLANSLDAKQPSHLESLVLEKIVINQLENDVQNINLQDPLAKKTNSIARSVIKKTAQFMPNNLGNWSIKKPYSFTTHLESELIKFLKHKYHCDKKIAGHFGSGSTEGNIYATWIGRNYLIKKLSLKDNKKVVMLKSCLAHYSLDKAADLTNIKLVGANIDQYTFSLDPKTLVEQIKKLYKQGFRGFLIPLTLGYTITGTDDDYETIAQEIERFEKSHTNCKCFLWLDAAFSGISKIYTEKNFSPLKYKNIQLITSDFHKLLAIPYPASFMLYRHNLLQLIEKKIPYIDQLDTTLLGSRPGINILATWMTLLNLEKEKMHKSIGQALQNKEKFLEGIAQERLNLQIVNNKNSLQACIISKDASADKILSSKYKLKRTRQKLTIGGKTKSTKMYKLYFFAGLI